jgi:hypothetical protein
MPMSADANPTMATILLDTSQPYAAKKRIMTANSVIRSPNTNNALFRKPAIFHLTSKILANDSGTVPSASMKIIKAIAIDGFLSPYFLFL